MIRSSDPQIGANQLEFNYQEIEHTLVSVETAGGGRGSSVIRSKNLVYWKHGSLWTCQFVNAAMTLVAPSTVMTVLAVVATVMASIRSPDGWACDGEAGHPSCSSTFKEAQNFLQKDHKNEGCLLSLHLKVTFGWMNISNIWIDHDHQKGAENNQIYEGRKE